MSAWFLCWFTIVYSQWSCFVLSVQSIQISLTLELWMFEFRKLLFACKKSSARGFKLYRLTAEWLSWQPVNVDVILSTQAGILGQPLAHAIRYISVSASTHWLLAQVIIRGRVDSGVARCKRSAVKRATKSGGKLVIFRVLITGGNCPYVLQGEGLQRERADTLVR